MRFSRPVITGLFLLGLAAIGVIALALVLGTRGAPPAAPTTRPQPESSAGPDAASPAATEQSSRTPSSQPIAINQWRGQPAPDFTLTTLDGATLKLSDLRGKPFVLNFWASWCAPCRAEMPAFERAWQMHKDKAVFIGVAVSDTEKDALAAAQKAGVTYPLGVDKDHTIALAYLASSIPSTYFVDASGIIVRKVASEMNEGAMTFFINSLLQ
jgi:peroxiredoxin